MKNQDNRVNPDKTDETSNDEQLEPDFNNIDESTLPNITSYLGSIQNLITKLDIASSRLSKIGNNDSFLKNLTRDFKVIDKLITPDKALQDLVKNHSYIKLGKSLNDMTNINRLSSFGRIVDTLMGSELGKSSEQLSKINNITLDINRLVKTPQFNALNLAMEQMSKSPTTSKKLQSKLHQASELGNRLQTPIEPLNPTDKETLDLSEQNISKEKLDSDLTTVPEAIANLIEYMEKICELQTLASKEAKESFALTRQDSNIHLKANIITAALAIITSTFVAFWLDSNNTKALSNISQRMILSLEKIDDSIAKSNDDLVVEIKKVNNEHIKALEDLKIKKN